MKIGSGSSDNLIIMMSEPIPITTIIINNSISFYLYCSVNEVNEVNEQTVFEVWQVVREAKLFLLLGGNLNNVMKYRWLIGNGQPVGYHVVNINVYEYVSYISLKSLLCMWLGGGHSSYNF